MKTLKYIQIGFLLFVTLVYSYGQNIPSEIVSITETNNSFLIDFNLPNYQIIDTNIYTVYGIDQNYSYIDVNSENFGTTWDVGYPCLPQLTINLSIPKGSTGFSLSSANIISDTIPLTYPLLPSQEDINDTIMFSINEQYYDSDGSSYSFTSNLSNQYVVMSKDGISLTIFPFQYNPLLNSISVISSATFTISFTPPQNNQDTILPEVKEYFLDKFFQNFQKSNSASESSPTYLIITPQKFKNTLDYFANYKRSLGFDVTVVTTETIGFSRENIKDYINSVYPIFVLLVGDIGDIPTYGEIDGSENYDPPTDLEYSLLDGNDYFPDVFLGRASVTTEAELQNFINKNVFMETNMHNLGNNAKFLAGWHLNGNDEPVQWWCHKFEEGHNYVIDNNFLAYNNEKIYAYSLNSTPQNARDALNDNPIFFIYSGHGEKTKLANPFDIVEYDINNRTHNTHPFGFSFACRTGNFAYDKCFGESWIRSPEGGISYFGCSVLSIAKPDVKLEKSLMSPVGWLGPMIDIGKVQFWLNYHTIFNNARWKRYMKSYNLLGDPSFRISGIGCFDEIIFTNNEIFHSGDIIMYHASDWIIAPDYSSVFVIESGADVTLKAGTSILLRPGFSSRNGSHFLAHIEECNMRDQGNPHFSCNNDTNFKKPINKSYEKQTDNSKVNVFPNPFTKSFLVEYSVKSPGRVYLEVMTTTGHKVFSDVFVRESGNYIFEYKDSNLPVGLYFLIIKTEDYKEVKRLIKIYR